MRLPKRLSAALGAAVLGALMIATPALACGGLIGPNGAVNLLRTTTFAGYHNGVEHYVTAFQFAGGTGKFGSIIPLPGVPSEVEKGGDWTLQRLVRETQPLRLQAFDTLAVPAAARGAEVLMERKIDALSITVLKGGADEVGLWARDHGFRLPPDAPEMLEFYARRSPIFLAAQFDADAARARGQQIGDGTPVHVTIPTPNPWVPLRILGLGKSASELVEADVYLLTDVKPGLLPGTTHDGLRLEHNAAATDLLLSDLRSDKGMSWVPDSGWLTKLAIDARADQLSFDLAVDATGQNAPSPVQAGLVPPVTGPELSQPGQVWLPLVFGALLLALAVVAGSRIGASSPRPA